MASRQAAIDAHCKWCIYDHLDHGTWREQVQNCTSTECALHEVRPVTIKSRNATRDSKKIIATDAVA